MSLCKSLYWFYLATRGLKSVGILHVFDLINRLMICSNSVYFNHLTLHLKGKSSSLEIEYGHFRLLLLCCYTRAINNVCMRQFENSNRGVCTDAHGQNDDIASGTGLGYR